MNSTDKFLIFNRKLFNEISDYLYKNSAIELIQKTRTKSAEYEFLDTRTPQGYFFYLRSPLLSSISNVFVLPFDTNVWFTCLAATLVVLFVLYIIAKWEDGNKMQIADKYVNDTEPLRAKIAEVAQLQIGIICQQGSESEPRSISGRIVTFIICFAVTFLYTSYSANIIALLRTSSDKLQTIKDLDKYNVKLLIDKDEFNDTLFYNSEIKMQQEHQQIYDRKISGHNCYVDPEKGVEELRGNFAVFYGEQDKVYTIIGRIFQDNQKCSIREIPFVPKMPFLVAVKKNTLKMKNKQLKIALALFQENGLHQRILLQVFTGRPKCHVSGASFISIGLQDCYFAAVIYASGVALSICIFLLELMLASNYLHIALKA